MISCRDECDQGRRQCPTPQACFLPEPDDDKNLQVDLALIGYVVVVLLCLVALLAYVLLNAKWI